MSASKVHRTDIRDDTKKESFDSGYQPSDSIDIEEMIGSDETITMAENGFHHPENGKELTTEKINGNVADVPSKTVSMSKAKKVHHIKNQISLNADSAPEGNELEKIAEEPSLVAECADNMNECFIPSQEKGNSDSAPTTNGSENIAEEPSLMTTSGDDSTVCSLAPGENEIKEERINVKMSNNEEKEMEEAAEKLVAKMLNELRQPIRQRANVETDAEVKPVEESYNEERRRTMGGNKLEHVAQQEDCYLAPELKEIEEMEEEAKKTEYKLEYVWVNVAIQIALHIGAFYGLYLAFTDASWKTNAWMVLMTLYAGNSITAGAHRMWCHKAYKANFGVRLFYMIGTTMSIQNDVIEWSRDHRVHHKWADSDADPHNINRGFFFSHMGWLMVRKHPKVKEMGKKVDMSDLEADPLLAFQRRHYVPLIFLSLYFLTAVPHYCWGETWNNAYFVGAILRLALQLHGTWFINSAAHTFGYKPFDTKITAVDTFFYACLTNGEAWHNYHHTFPQDYRASEYMWKGNMSAVMIDFFAYMGWVWDRKTMSKEAIARQKLKGDHSRPLTAARED